MTETQETMLPQTEVGASMAGVVREAWLATSELSDEVAQETREIAFKLVLEAMLRNPGTASAAAESTNSEGASAPNGASTHDDIYATPELRMDAISSYLEIRADEIEILFGLGSTEPTLQIDPAQLAHPKGTATREIALLLLGSRTALGIETHLEDIRRVAEQYRKYDPGNFAKTLQSSPEFVVLGKPRSSQRTVRLRGVGLSAARKLAQRLVAG